MDAGRYWHRVGACLYLAWAAVRLASAYSVLELAGGLPGVMGHIAGRLAEDAWFTIWTAGLAAAIAAWLNWVNNALGYWLNLFLVTLCQGGLIAFLIAPGHASTAEAVASTALWLGAVVFTTLGYRRRAPGVTA